jgi:hypothetical protein
MEPTVTPTPVRAADCRGVGDCARSNSTFRPGALGSGEFGGDGNLDLIVAGRDDPLLQIRPGAGDGTFTTFGAPLRLAGAEGGLDDLAVSELTGGSSLVIVSNSDGNLVLTAISDGMGGLVQGPSFALPGAPTRLLLADLTGDGIADLAVATATQIAVLRGLGGGNFEALTPIDTGSRASDLALIDANGDGRLDLVAALRAENSVEVYTATGGGAFAPGSSIDLPNPQALAVADFTGDGRDDLVVSTAGGQLALLPGTPEGLGPAEAATEEPVSADRLRVADLDGDERADLVAIDASLGQVRAVLNDGAGGFIVEPEVRIQSFDVVAGSAVGDFDGNGTEDITISQPQRRELVTDLSPVLCIGDCDRDGEVRVNELILGVNIGLDRAALAACIPADVNRDDGVSISEIITAVNNLLFECLRGSAPAQRRISEAPRPRARRS